MLDNFHSDMTFAVDCARQLSPGWVTIVSVLDNFHPDVTFAADCTRQLSPWYDLCGWLCKTTFTRIWPLRLTVQDNFHPVMPFVSDCAKRLSPGYDLSGWLCKTTFIPIWLSQMTALALVRYDLWDWLCIIDGAWYIFRLTFHEIMCAFGTSF